MKYISLWQPCASLIAVGVLLAGCNEPVDGKLPQFPYRGDCEQMFGECEKRWRGDLPFYQPARRAP